MDNMVTAEPEKIKIGDFIIIQRQKYTKLHKLTATSAPTLGREIISLDGVQGEKYFTTFKMVLTGSNKKRVYDLEPCPDFHMTLTDEIAVAESGNDNRNILDDGQAQRLTAEEIDTLKGSGKTSTEIVAQIVGNSQSFANKTEFSQEKYLRKKEKKYFEYIQIRKPTLRLINDIYYRQDPDKMLGLRMDTLSQILTYSNVSCFSKCLLYESGTNGIVLAGLLSRMGPIVDDDDSGKMVYMHPGNFQQKQAVNALNLSEDRLVPVNIYSVLRHFYQNMDTTTPVAVVASPKEAEEEDSAEPEAKKMKVDETAENGQKNNNNNNGQDENEKEIENENEESNQEMTELTTTPEKPKKKWQLDNEEGCRILSDKMDSLVIVAREEPVSILRNLLPFMKPSSPVVVYSQCREVLMDCYNDMKSGLIRNVTDIHIYSSFQRNYQVLPDRTHPDINMSGNSGYILTATTVKN